MAATSLHDDVPKNVASERPIALMPTLIRWWEAMRASEVTKWQQRCRIEWDAVDGRNGGVQQTVWKMLLEMVKFKYRAGEEDLGAVALVLDLAKAFERVSLPVVWAWATHFSFPRKILRVLCGYFEHQRRVRFEGCVAEPLQTITAILPARGTDMAKKKVLSAVPRTGETEELNALCANPCWRWKDLITLCDKKNTYITFFCFE